ncbi:hypothetical protein GCM10010094_46920 [Streptomyces flaveus]|uniref:Transposase n=1 Tax=Streptomyces flaveus TaxID=66370 RepID=A0A917R035_9ACTN|nr:hypothetical protein GCM10010094_46920 [Streptomyces flaveus]
MKTELDSLATAPHVKTEDPPRDSPHLAPWRPTVGITPLLSDAELVTLAMMQAMLGFTSEARWLRHARSHLRHLFPYLPKQPGYNKRLRKAAELLRQVTRLPAVHTSVWSDDVWIVNSTPVECGRSRETVKRSDLAGCAEYGYCASHRRFFWGLRLHLVCTLQTLPVALDTFLVRTVLVPALALDLGRWFWWPGSLFHRLAHDEPNASASPSADAPTPAHDPA